MDLGLSQTQTVLVIYGLSFVLAVLSFVLSGAGQLYGFLGVVVASGFLLLVLTRRSLVIATSRRARTRTIQPKRRRLRRRSRRGRDQRRLRVATPRPTNGVIPAPTDGPASAAPRRLPAAAQPVPTATDRPA